MTLQWLQHPKVRFPTCWHLMLCVVFWIVLEWIFQVLYINSATDALDLYGRKASRVHELPGPALLQCLSVDVRKPQWFVGSLGFVVASFGGCNTLRWNISLMKRMTIHVKLPWLGTQVYLEIRGKLYIYMWWLVFSDDSSLDIAISTIHILRPYHF